MTNGGENGWLKQLFPRGIYARAALILFLPVVTVTLVVSIMFLQRHFDGVTRQMTSSMAREISFVARRIDQSENAAVATLAGEGVAAPLGLTLRLPPATDMAVEDRRDLFDLTGRVVIDELHDQVPELQAVDLVQDDREVLLLMEGRFGPYSLSFDRRRISASNPHQLLVLMLFTSLLMSGISSIFLRNQLRPIRRLARAAEAYGKGRVVPYKPTGAAEVRSAGAAFLAMRNRIERQNEQRILMLSGISHDLRTPLTRLRLGVSMLSPDLPPDAPEIAAMEADIAEMSHMVDAFLDLVRDEAQDRPPEPVAVIPFLRGIVADAQRAGRDVRLLQVAGDDGDGGEEIIMRPEAMRRAIDNLIGNAVRYGTRAEVELILGPRSALIAVEDDGPGIPENRRDEAMRPFTRLDPARSQNRGQSGAGLGLSIASDVVSNHGGRLRLSEGRNLPGLRAEIMLPR